MEKKTMPNPNGNGSEMIAKTLLRLLASTSSATEHESKIHVGIVAIMNNAAMVCLEQKLSLMYINPLSF
jgi:hypothetical protein